MTVERLGRSFKYEDVYLKDYGELTAARAGIGSWLRFYNRQRPHQALDNHTPRARYRGLAPLRNVRPTPQLRTLTT